MSLVFGQQFRSPKRFDPRPDQVVAFGIERVGLGIASRPSAVDDVCLVSIPEKWEENVNYKEETEGVPLFTSPTLNISRIEVGKRG